MTTKSYLTGSTEVPKVAYVYLTYGCNSNGGKGCNHCYLEANYGRIKEMMPMELRKRVIDEVSRNNIRKIKFSGGEVTLLYDLADTLRYASEVQKKTGFPEDIEIQTNAYFLIGLEEPEIEKRLKELKSSGLNTLNIASKDDYHDISYPELDKIEKVAKRVFGDSNVRMSGAPEGIVPTGRAITHVPKEKWYTGSCYHNSMITEAGFLAISVDGGVHPYCWPYYPVGNLRDKSLSDILEDVRKPSNIFRKLDEKGGFSGLDPEEDLKMNKEELRGFYLERWGSTEVKEDIPVTATAKEEFDRIVKTVGEGAFCHEFFKRLSEKGQKQL